jgi:hypothetical protein
VVREQRFHGSAQQGREVAGHRRYEKDARIGGALGRRKITVKMDETTKRAFPNDLLSDCYVAMSDPRRVQSERRLLVSARRALEQFERGGGLTPSGRTRKRVEGTFRKIAERFSQGARRLQRGMAHLVPMV